MGKIVPNCFFDEAIWSFTFVWTTFSNWSNPWTSANVNFPSSSGRKRPNKRFRRFNWVTFKHVKILMFKNSNIFELFSIPAHPLFPNAQKQNRNSPWKWIWHKSGCNWKRHPFPRPVSDGRKSFSKPRGPIVFKQFYQICYKSNRVVPCTYIFIQDLVKSFLFSAASLARAAQPETTRDTSRRSGKYLSGYNLNSHK